jgi:endonuclease/exonuclease/phosphatase (EEP) superfamily protein YafD
VFATAVLLALVTLLTIDRIAAWPFELLANFRVQLLEAAIVLMLLALLLRARVTLVLCIVLVVLNGAVVVPSFTGSQPAAAKGTSTLEIGHLNAQSGTIDVAALRSYLARTRPAVFVILNPNPSTVQALQANGGGYGVIPETVSGGQFAWAVLLTRVPIFAVRHPVEAGLPDAAVQAVVEMGTTPVALLFLHTESPFTPSRATHMHRALAAAARWSRAVKYAHVVEGDLNTTPWSSAFDTLLRNGRLHNSLVGFGIQASWPAGFGLGRIPIDHALLSAGLTAVARRTGPSFGSEHRSLEVTVAARQ